MFFLANPHGRPTYLFSFSPFGDAGSEQRVCPPWKENPSCLSFEPESEHNLTILLGGERSSSRNLRVAAAR